MRIIFAAFSILAASSLQAQKLDVQSLESILNASFNSADSTLRKMKFGLADRDFGEGYYNYYYTSYEKVEKNEQLLRSLSFMDVFTASDTSRLILYRTYNKKDQEEIVKQMLATGYQLTKREGNNYIYKKENFTITNKISEKNLSGGKPITAYEFELGR